MATSSALSDPQSRYQQALHRLLGLVDYERLAGAAAPMPKHELERMRELARRAGDPSRPGRDAPVVHIAGTKGKGSVAAMVSSILCAAGYKVGLFTSPHLHTFRERFRLNGEPCTEAQFADALEAVWPHVEAMAAESPYGRPSTFEVMTAMAFALFRGEGVDVQVLEVGLGGRLDSTNVADGDVAVITSLSLDHIAILGDTLPQIAYEKAGIIKPGAQVVVAPQESEAMAVIEAKASDEGASLTAVGRDITWQGGAHDLTGQAVRVATPQAAYDLWVPLLGAHQQQNAAVAVGAIEALAWGITPEQVAEGMRRVSWDGRFQVLGRRRVDGPVLSGVEGPLVVVDGAHNPYSMARLCEAVREVVAPERTHVVFGCSGDKQVGKMIAELAKLADEVVVCASRHPRSVPPEGLVVAFASEGVTASAAPSVADAVDAACAAGGPNHLVLVTGSLFVVAEAIEAWQGILGERYPEFEPLTAANI